MPKKKGKADETEQVAFRAPVDLIARMDAVRERLGLDTSNFMRMLMIECLPVFEKRADKIEGGEWEPEPLKP